MLRRAADDREAIKRMPWNVIVMVCGMTVLIALLEKTQGIDLFVSLLAGSRRAETVTGGRRVHHRRDLGLQQHVGRGAARLSAHGAGAGPAAWRSGRACDCFVDDVGGHLVDVSPLSTIGALCIASAVG